MQEKYVELRQQEGMSSSPVFCPPSPFCPHNREGERYLSFDLSHLCNPQYTHHHTSLVSLSSRRVTVKLALPLSVCHVVSLLLCNFLFFPLSSFPERMCLLSLRESVSGG